MGWNREAGKDDLWWLGLPVQNGRLQQPTRRALREVVEEINRYRRGKVLLGESALARAPVSGRFRIDDPDAALEQLGRYYSKGTLVQQDRKRAVIFLREAAALGNLKAQMQLAELFIDGYGSPYDYQDAYHWLYNAITDDKSTHSQIAVYLTELEKLMHPRAVRAARKPLDS